MAFSARWLQVVRLLTRQLRGPGRGRPNGSPGSCEASYDLVSEGPEVSSIAFAQTSQEGQPGFRGGESSFTSQRKENKELAAIFNLLQAEWLLCLYTSFLPE